MPKENTVLTIDVGGDSLKMAEFVFPPGGAVVLRKFAFRKLEEREGEDSSFAEAYLDYYGLRLKLLQRLRLLRQTIRSNNPLDLLPKNF